MISLVLPLLALGGMMIFMNRSQKKQQNERQSLLDSMKVGDKIVTIGGLHGVIHEIDNENRTIFIDCEGIILEFDRAAIKTVKPTATSSDNGNATTTETIAEVNEDAAVENTTSTEEVSEPNETKE